MFSGIIETVGIIVAISNENGCRHFCISPQTLLEDLKIGDSISINGACLTITALTQNAFYVTAVPETLRLTNLNYLTINQAVNLERSICANSRIGGHFVQGHVDGLGQILEIYADNSDALLAKISIPLHLSKYVIAKGYITLDGMSITVIDANADWFTVTFVPHTQSVTTVKHYQKQSLINIEVDMMAKYVEKILGVHQYARN